MRQDDPLTHDRRDVELLDTLDRISHEALRAGAIIHRLRDLVRRRDSQHTECDLNELVRDVASLAGLDAIHNGIRLELDLAGTLPPVVADRIQVQQVILNLVRNAMEAMETDSADDRTVSLRTLRGDNGTVEVAIVDRGEGVAVDEEAELFEPFYTTMEAGMGMGLSISRSIVRAHGGRVWFTRKRGPRYYFPLHAPGRERSRRCRLTLRDAPVSFSSFENGKKHGAACVRVPVVVAALFGQFGELLLFALGNPRRNQSCAIQVCASRFVPSGGRTRVCRNKGHGQ